MMGKRLARITRSVLLAAVCIWAVFPLYWMFTQSTLSPEERFQDVPLLFPQFLRLTEYPRLIAETDMLLWLKNSIIIAGGVTILTLSLALLAAYALSRYRFRGTGLFSFSLFTTQMLPETLLIVPLFIIMSSLNLLDQLSSVILASAAFVMPACVFILKGAIDSVPVEVEESALLDGTPRWALLWTVVLPLVAPALAAASVFAFFWGWNEYLFSVTFLQSSDQWPAAVGLGSFVGEYITPIESIMAAAVIYTVPAVIFFWLVQRWMVQGLTAGAVKG